MKKETIQASKAKESAVAANRLNSMDAKLFGRFSEFIHAEFGIKLPPSKKTMLEARLQKRLRFLGFDSHKQYCEFVFSPEGMQKELIHLIDVVTTNTTHFFREPRHFEILNESVLPALYRTHANRKPIKVWSAGCSTGEEPYTLSMVLAEFAARNQGFRWNILATDISTEVLGQAARAVYSEDKAESIPLPLKKKYLLRSKDRSRKLVRIDKSLRSNIEFRRLNFMDEFDLGEIKDVIFCRNVVIYFDRQTQERLFNKFCRHMGPDSYLFIGHSESLTGMDLPLEALAPTVYRRA
ncbi:MAG: protein-glutamate O-methyltransferase CheR [Desulfovibrionaceae bacterium]|jgi:chemotaxis protein methyltransferase CheR